MAQILITIPDGEDCGGCACEAIWDGQHLCRALAKQGKAIWKTPDGKKCPACIEAIKQTEQILKDKK